MRESAGKKWGALMVDKLTPLQEKRMHDAIRIVIAHLLELPPTNGTSNPLTTGNLKTANGHHEESTPNSASHKEDSEQR